MKPILAALLAALVCTGAVRAEAPAAAPGAMLTLPRALELAGVKSPVIEAAKADLQAAHAARTVAGLRPNPSLGVDLENVAGNGDYRGTRSAETTARLDFPIELGGKRSARIAGAQAGMARTEALGLAAEADLRLDITQGYAEAAAAERLLETARDQARIAADASRAARLRVSAGRASPIEVQRAEVERIGADAKVRQAERRVTTSRARLSRLIGAPVTEPLDMVWFQATALPPALQTPAASTLVAALADADVAAADADVRRQQAARLPDLTLGAGVRRLHEADSTAAVFSLSLPMPLFNNGQAALSGARAQRQAADARRRLALIEQEQALAQAQADLLDAAAAAAASGPALAASEEAARIARIGYANGKFGQLDLLDAERTLSETRMNAIDAHLATRIAQARLERLAARAPDNTPTRGGN